MKHAGSLREMLARNGLPGAATQALACALLVVDQDLSVCGPLVAGYVYPA
jgi:hypothetical protein